MRRLTFLIACLVLGLGNAFATTETLYLKNGSVIKGEIIEQIPGKSLKIQTKDGSIFVYSMDDVEKITKEHASSGTSIDSNGHKGLDFSIGTGYNIATKGGSSSIPVDFILSKRFNRNFAFGVGTGAEIGTGGGKPVIPIFADFKAFFPLSESKLTPLVDLRLGYGINTEGDQTYGSGKNAVTVEVPNNITFSIMPGIRIPLSYRTDVDFAIGYLHNVPTSGGGGSGAIAFKVGFNFHRSTNPNFVNIEKPETPTRSSGFQFGLEGFGTKNYGGALLFGYKYSHRLSFALGLGYSATSIKCPDMVTTYYSEPEGQGSIIEEHTREGVGHESVEGLIAFIRGQYRFTDRRLSPIATVDFGYMGNNFYDDYYTSEDGKSGIFVRPTVGISWRTTRNSYLEASVGYTIRNSISDYDEISEYRNNNIRSVCYSAKGPSLSGLAVSLTWKHTFGLFSRD